MNGLDKLKQKLWTSRKRFPRPRPLASKRVSENPPRHSTRRIKDPKDVPLFKIHGKRIEIEIGLEIEIEMKIRIRFVVNLLLPLQVRSFRDKNWKHARLKTCITRSGCPVRSLPTYQNDQCNEAHLFSPSTTATENMQSLEHTKTMNGFRIENIIPKLPH